MKKHAYIIVSNNNFRVLEAALHLIDDTRNDIYLLFDKKSKVSKHQKSNLCSICNQSQVHVCKDKIVNWGGIHRLMR
jgi:hypothetical protein